MFAQPAKILKNELIKNLIHNSYQFNDWKFLGFINFLKINSDGR